jgi:hypothetical protein
MRLIVLFVCLPMLTLALPPDHKAKIAGYLNAYVATEGVLPGDFSLVYQLLDKLESKKGNTADRKFIQTIFRKTHQHFLKSFKEDATFHEMMATGEYNCLTATSLYSLILDYFDVSHSIIETNYHIFLMVNTSDGKVLLETTDPVTGLISNDHQIASKIAEYKSGKLEKENASKYFPMAGALYNEVNADHLVGLLHYNLSIAAFNKGEIEQAVSHLEKASQFYYSARLKEFSKLLIIHIVKSGAMSGQKLVLRLKSINDQERSVILATAKT